MATSDTHFGEMVTVAREYCRMIERINEADGDYWLAGMAELLPRLHAAIASLHGALSEAGLLPLSDLETRFELYSHLKAILGERDGYWMEYDVAVDGQSMSGSLADDFTDIYFELKQGLKILDRHPGAPDLAIGEWEFGYRLHWGQHLVDAERHLYTLCSRNQLTT